MLQILDAGCLGLFSTISAHFIFERCTADKNCKNTKMFFEGLRSFKVIDVGTRGKLISGACYDKSLHIFASIFTQPLKNLSQNSTFLWQPTMKIS